MLPLPPTTRGPGSKATALADDGARGRRRPQEASRPGDFGRISLLRLGLILTVQLIPVVTFLAPLASNFEGLKDR